MDTIRVGGIPTVRTTMDGLVSRMIDDCALARVRGDAALPKLVFASNGSVIARYHREPSYKALMDQADLIDADGMPMILVSRLFGAGLPERIATTDFIFAAAQGACRAGLRFYFLGGRSEDTQRAVRYFSERYPALQIVGWRDGYFSPAEEPTIAEEIRSLQVDVLWVGLGSPLQEAFAVRMRPMLSGVGWIRTCGGMFDYYSGRASRAPMWLQRLGLEWLYRVMQEPRRLGGRYLRTNIPALYHLLTKTSAKPLTAMSPTAHMGWGPLTSGQGGADATKP